MDDFNYLDCYLAFQDEFKPVKSYTSQQDIIKKALDVFANVVEKYKDKKFIKNIKLLYPNYFTESADGRFVPIIDELIFLNDSSDTQVKLNQLKARVLKHMSFYLTNNLDADVEQRSFIRISKVLIENRKSSIHSFYVMKVNDSEKPESYYYRIYINEDTSTKYELAPPTDTDRKRYYPDSIAEGERVQGDFIPEGDKGVYSFSSDGRAAIPGPDADEEVRLNESEINSTESFYNLFCEPLSAHYVMLENTSLLYVYSQTAQIEKEESTLGYGGMFVLIERGASDSEVKQYAQFFRLISDSISTCIAHNIMREKLENESRKSAKAAIMARNMSHNLGSHVIAYLKQHLHSTNSILRDNVLYEMIPASEYSSYCKMVDRCLDNEQIPDWSFSVRYDSIALPFLVGLGNFLSYLQERQDFIATIATDHIPYYSTVNFKDFIYDELNPDKRFERHKDRGKSLKPDNILLGNIARSEGLGRQASSTEKECLADIVIRFRDFDGGAVVNDSGLCIDGRKEALESLDVLRSLEVSLPGGMVGRQALFSIVENLIRNAAKHGDWQKAGKLEFTFDIFDKEKLGEIKEDSLGDHLSLKEVLRLYYSQATDADDLLFMTITDNVKSDYQTVRRIEEAINEYKDIGRTDVMKEGKKGIKELLISSAWLRGAKDESEYCFPSLLGEQRSSPQKEKRAPLMYVRLSQDRDNDGDDTGRLQYIFCLLIPKTVAIVSKSLKLGRAQQKKASSLSWRVFSPQEFVSGNKGYSFVLCEDKECLRTVRRFSPSKIALIESIPTIDRGLLYGALQKGLTQKSSLQYELELFRFFSGAENDKAIICIDDKKVYSKAANSFNTYPSLYVKYVWQNGTFIRSDEKDVVTESIEGVTLYDGMRLKPEKTYYRIGNVMVTDGGGFGEYVYRTHHDSRKEFGSFMTDNSFLGCRFVEGITGNSSTDRLVRNDILNERWFYSHFRAMKRKVAILDERLFSRVYGLEEVSFTRAKLIRGDLNEMKAGYSQLFSGSSAHVEKLCSLDSKEEIEEFIFEKPLLRKQLYRDTCKSRDSMAAVYFQKGIMFFTVFKEDPSIKSVGLYGIHYPNNQDVVGGFVNNEDYRAICTKLATMSWGEQGLSFDFCNDSEIGFFQSFDYISIHQGILDKLYKAFSIKDVEQKKTLIRQLYFHLKKDSSEECDDFLPDMTVHSGRSRPNETDLPLQLPFIQFAALEHAALDCKYSLIELLDNARYEQ